jgi:hypothetical protein
MIEEDEYTEVNIFHDSRQDCWWWATADQWSGPFSSLDAVKKDFEVEMFGPGVKRRLEAEYRENFMLALRDVLEIDSERARRKLN